MNTFNDIIQSIIDLFNTGESIALSILLATSFLIGYIIRLFLYLPKTRKLKKSITLQKEINTSLEGNHKNLEENYNIQQVRLTKLEKENASQAQEITSLSTNNKNLSETNTDLTQKVDHFKKGWQQSQTELQELKNLNAKLNKEISIFEQKTISALNTKEKAVQQYQDAHAELNKAQTQLKEVTAIKEQQTKTLLENQKALTSSNEQLELFMKDIRERDALIIQLQSELFDTKTTLKITDTKTDALRKDLELSNQKLNELKQISAQIKTQLKVYSDQESKIKAIESQENTEMESFLEMAKHSFDNNIFQGTHKEIDSFIEDNKALASNLAKIDTHLIENTKADLLSIDQEEHELMEQHLAKAGLALKMKGFYKNMDSAPFINQSTDQIDEDLLIDFLYNEANQVVDNNNLLYTIHNEELIEDVAILENNLSEIKTHDPVSQNTELQYNDDEDKAMERAIFHAAAALEKEGLYTTIDPKKLIETTSYKDTKESVTPKYHTAIDQAVAQLIEKQIPAKNTTVDDLRKIEGISPFINRKLNYYGITSYIQLSKLSEELIQKLSAAIGLPERTIKEQKWVDQARKLYASQES